MKFLPLILLVGLFSCSTMGPYKADKESNRQKRLNALAKMGLYSTKDREYYNYCFLLWDLIHLNEVKLKNAKYPNPQNPFEEIDARGMTSNYRELKNRLPVDSSDFYNEIRKTENQIELRKIYKKVKCSDHSK